MLLKIWRVISFIGTDPNRERKENRHIIICNRISLILSGFTFLLFVIALIYFGWIITVKMALGATFFFLFPIILNQYGYVSISRVLLLLSLNMVSLVASVADKFDVPGMLEEFQYFQFRLLILAGSIFPFILFKLQERKRLISGVLISFLCLVFYDPIHHLFDVGYYDVGFSAPNYYFTNYMVGATFLIITGSSFFLKYSFETYERQNEILIENLSQAKAVIQEQQEQLASENILLNREVVEKNAQLSQTNEELIRHNNDLLQFSYTVSHNLRGPVASLIGLVNLFERKELKEDHQVILQHLELSSERLDTTIKDLGSIIDLRNSVSKTKQRLEWITELEHITMLLKKEIEDQKVELESDFSEAPTVYSIKPMVTSILYNLVSNAIKYHSPDRKLKINIRTTQTDNLVRLDVSDNGMGIDLDKFKDKVFGLYKRFHTHTEGKGLGLFLVKLQAETLGGRAEVKSKLDFGTTFSIFISSSHQDS
ncbi:MAG TPA: HAMP domain-containing sensor histidine kinase [Chryseolinea sp.]|nr:HAMP domain-containing sensor histidine kinase [Chryseolinea sp.]